MSYLTQGRGPEMGEGTGPLTVGFGSRTDPAEASDTIGQEYTFGLRMREAVDGPILIIKTAWGGKSLHTDFRPPSAGSYELNEHEQEAIAKRGLNIDEEAAARRERSGAFYRLMVEHVEKVLSDPARVVPGYDPQQGYELAGLVWFQCWNDMVDGSVYPGRGTPGSYDAYSELLATFIRDVRRDLEAPEMPFVIGVMGTNGPIENLDPRRVSQGDGGSGEASRVSRQRDRRPDGPLLGHAAGCCREKAGCVEWPQTAVGAGRQQGRDQPG